jgi:hypothetical protein
MNNGSTAPQSRWLKAWPDLLAFGLTLVLAWQREWQTTELVWSLWLSSLLVGYAMIVWILFGPVCYGWWQAGAAGGRLGDVPKRPTVVRRAGHFILAVFMLAFFTVHFGMFHLVHSVFLSIFFPLAAMDGTIGFGGYWFVLQEYWPFVLLAALAERQAFRFPPGALIGPVGFAVTADAIGGRENRNAGQGFDAMTAPYKNVIRLHLLIFFFAFAHFVKLENFLVYAVVYAVYFFPWELRCKPAITVETHAKQ